eukprot:2531848-Rhodomonas_salina.1
MSARWAALGQVRAPLQRAEARLDGQWTVDSGQWRLGDDSCARSMAIGAVWCNGVDFAAGPWLLVRARLCSCRVWVYAAEVPTLGPVVRRRAMALRRGEGSVVPGGVEADGGVPAAARAAPRGGQTAQRA